jgi:hypothetical protein
MVTCGNSRITLQDSFVFTPRVLKKIHFDKLQRQLYSRDCDGPAALDVTTGEMEGERKLIFS